MCVLISFNTSYRKGHKIFEFRNISFMTASKNFYSFCSDKMFNCRNDEDHSSRKVSFNTYVTWSRIAIG